MKKKIAKRILQIQEEVDNLAEVLKQDCNNHDYKDGRCDRALEELEWLKKLIVK